MEHRCNKGTKCAGVGTMHSQTSTCATVAIRFCSLSVNQSRCSMKAVKWTTCTGNNVTEQDTWPQKADAIAAQVLCVYDVKAIKRRTLHANWIMDKSTIGSHGKCLTDAGIQKRTIDCIRTFAKCCF